MKKRHLVSFLLVAIIALTLISCDGNLRSQISDLMDSVSGNVYIDNGMIAANLANAEATTAIVTAIASDSSSVDSTPASGGSASVPIGSGSFTVVVTTQEASLVTLPTQDATEQDELESDLADTFASPTQTAALVVSLSEPASSTQTAAVTGSIAVFNATIAQLQTSLTSSPELATALGSLTLSVPDTLTQADVLTVQLLTNLISNTVNTLESLGDLDSIDSTVLSDHSAEILSIVDDAFFAAKVAEQLSGASNIDFTGQIDLASLMAKGMKGISLSDVDPKVLSVVNGLSKNIIKLLNGSYVNGVYTLTDAQYQTFLFNQQVYRAGMEQALVLMNRSGAVPTDMTFDVGTMAKYLISVAVTEFNKFYEAEKTETSESLALIISDYIDANQGLITGSLQSTEDALTDFDSSVLGFVIEDRLPIYLKSLQETFYTGIVVNLQTINSIDGYALLDPVFTDLLDTGNDGSIHAWYTSL